MPAGFTVCPADYGALTPTPAGVRCTVCHVEYPRGEHGYLELARPGTAAVAFETTAPHYASVQETSGERIYVDYLRPWLQRDEAHRVLDAGCGIGGGVAAMLADGFDAYGIDLPGAARHWRALDRDPEHFTCGSVTELPFADDSFDAVVTLGVVEHVGTLAGHVSLAPDWREQRAAFARELVRVTKPGGRILLSCPNKGFPIDVQHGPQDDDAEDPSRVRAWIFRRTGFNVHQVWGEFYLPSYRDVRRWFAGHEWHALPMRGFFGFAVFDDPAGRPGVAGRLAGVARRYVEALPAPLRRTALNPYILVEVIV